MDSSRVDGLAVVLLLSKDTEVTAAFYRDVLGVALVGEQHDGRHKHFACRMGTSYFTIQPAADLSAPAPDGGYDFLQLCFTVADLNAFLTRLAAAGIKPLHPPLPFEHTTFVTLLDPDGRHVRVMTPWAKSS